MGTHVEPTTSPSFDTVDLFPGGFQLPAGHNPMVLKKNCEGNIVLVSAVETDRFTLQHFVNLVNSVELALAMVSDRRIWQRKILRPD